MGDDWQVSSKGVGPNFFQIRPDMSFRRACRRFVRGTILPAAILRFRDSFATRLPSVPTLQRRKPECSSARASSRDGPSQEEDCRGLSPLKTEICGRARVRSDSNRPCAFLFLPFSPSFSLPFVRHAVSSSSLSSLPSSFSSPLFLPSRLLHPFNKYFSTSSFPAGTILFLVNLHLGSRLLRSLTGGIS